ncbi:MAG: YihY/virulence factor BrkB family protein [Dehalococcoidales bacterium]|jgi:membrane protein
MGNTNVILRKIKNRLLQIPIVRVLLSTIQESGNHDAGQRAAGVAYYAIISIFPLLLGLIAVFGFFLPSVNLQNSLLNFVGNNIPGATNILKENISGIIRLRGVMSILSIVILFWGASALFGSISLAINRAWNINKQRHFFIRKASEIGMVIGTGILFLLSLGASTFISFMGNALNLPDRNLAVVNLGAKLIAFLLMLAIFLLLYKFVPNTKTRWRDIWPGAVLAAVFFEIARALFIFYLEHFANYQAIYGTISSFVILLVWIYYSAFILILGAEFTFQYSHSRAPAAADSSTDE